MVGITTLGVDVVTVVNMDTNSMNCIKHHFRKRDSMIICFICTKLGHIAKNFMNTGKIEDEKKARVDDIRK